MALGKHQNDQKKLQNVWDSCEASEAATCMTCTTCTFFHSFDSIVSLGGQTSLYPAWLHVTGSASEEEAPQKVLNAQNTLSFSMKRVYFQSLSIDCFA